MIPGPDPTKTNLVSQRVCPFFFFESEIVPSNSRIDPWPIADGVPKGSVPPLPPSLLFELQPVENLGDDRSLVVHRATLARIATPKTQIEDTLVSSLLACCPPLRKLRSALNQTGVGSVPFFGGVQSYGFLMRAAYGGSRRAGLARQQPADVQFRIRAGATDEGVRGNSLEFLAGRQPG